jgi:ABC-type glycerol-3-phosphate transport system substrate-binding protein
MNLSRSLACMAVVSAALAFAGCGGLDTPKLEREIKSGIEKQTNIKVKTVDCPDNRDIKKGDAFTCTVTDTSGNTGQVKVTQTDDKGNVRWQLGK